jgi:hypothetical protein
MGMFGACGKTNDTSSNLLRLLQFSARKILLTISLSISTAIGRAVPTCPAIPKSMGNDDCSRVSLKGGNYQRCLMRHTENCLYNVGRECLGVETWGIRRGGDGSWSASARLQHAKAGTRVKAPIIVIDVMTAIEHSLTISPFCHHSLDQLHLAP